MGAVELSREGDVAVVRMVRDENRFHPELLDALNAALDEVEGADGPAAVVLTGAGKFFSNGLDLDYMGGLGDPDAVTAVLDRVHDLYARVLGFPVLTVAAVNGHAFAGGAMLALACDQRVMRSDRGYFCLPEVDLGIPFTPGMNALITAKLDHTVVHDAMLTGRRYAAEEAVALRIADAQAPEEGVVAEAVQRAAGLAAKPRHAVAAIKARLYAEPIAVLQAGGM